MTASFFSLSSAFQSSPGPILNKAHSISDKYKPPIKKGALLYFPDCSQFSVHFCLVLYPMVFLILGKSSTKSQRRGYPRIISLKILHCHRGFAHVFNHFPCSFCWHRACQSQLISSFSSVSFKKRSAKKTAFCFVQGSFALKANSTCTGRNSSYLAKINWKTAPWDAFTQFRWSCREASEMREQRDKVTLPLVHGPRPWNPGFDFSLLFFKI